MNCPFYGHAYYAAPYVINGQPPFVLYPTRGNQCALVTVAHSPCRMETAGDAPDWKRCALVKEARGETVE